MKADETRSAPRLVFRTQQGLLIRPDARGRPHTCPESELPVPRWSQRQGHR